MLAMASSQCDHSCNMLLPWQLYTNHEIARLQKDGCWDSYLSTRSAVAVVPRKATTMATMSEGSTERRRMMLDGVGPCSQTFDGFDG